ncbi:MAG: Transcriptional regulator, TrmB [Parcubacteria group bacterium GW2011_GWA2_42_35]|nr:MAG: Transcriptional regulator, TrmB [Parcubacteria group bacterium GW2011_GWA2_42_35]
MFNQKMDILALELRKLGLSQKEIAVYLAGLELGYNSAQNIAKKAGLSRTTAYQIIKDLEKKGLMAESKEKGQISPRLAGRGKTYYNAESPDKLLGILRLEKRALEEKEREFVRIISALKSKYYLNKKSEIRTYEGQAGLKFLTDDFSQTQAKEILIIGDSPVFLKLFKSRCREIKKRLRQTEIKEIAPPADGQKFSKKIPGLLILYDKIIYFPSAKKPLALLIENQPLLELFKLMFNLGG